jgi:hypothetical protein
MTSNLDQKSEDGTTESSPARKKERGDKKEAVISNPFIAHTVYPDPAAIFSFRLQTIEEIKDTCYVVLDTNILLIPYTVTQESVQTIKDTYTKLKARDQLRIPAQVAREFAKNRPMKLTALYQQLARKRNTNFQVQSSRYPLLAELEAYKDLTRLEQELQRTQEQYRIALGRLQEQVRSWSWNDPVSTIYGVLFTPETIVEPTRTEDESLADLQRRVVHSIPPGYKDGAKEDEGIGDLLIWYTILELGQNRPVVFVTAEAKADWWYRSENQALYPRYELIDEFRRVSGGKTLHIITLSDLLRLFGVAENVVQQVKTQEQEQQRSDEAATSEINLPQRNLFDPVVDRLTIIRHWLQEQVGIDRLLFAGVRETYQYYVENTDNTLTVFEVILVPNFGSLETLTRMMIAHTERNQIKKSKVVANYCFILACPSPTIAGHFHRFFGDRSELKDSIVIVGFMNDGAFFPLSNPFVL